LLNLTVTFVKIEKLVFMLIQVEHEWKLSPEKSVIFCEFT